MSDWDSISLEDWDEPQSLCPCGKEMILPSGSKDAKWLIVGEFPGKEELKKGKPFVGGTGGVFNAELRRLGYSLSEFRIVNIWMHEKTDDPICKQYGVQQILKEAQGKEMVLLVGSDAVKEFTDFDVSDVNGLIVKSPYFSRAFAMYNPAIVFHESIGEMRFALENFIKEIERG